MHIGSLTGLLWRAINDMKHNKSHSLPTKSSEVAMKIASALLEWLPHHPVETDAFVSWLCESLQSCFHKKQPTSSKRRIVIWRKYHILRTSDKYCKEWNSFLYCCQSIIIIFYSVHWTFHRQDTYVVPLFT